MIGKYELNKIYCEDSYEAIKEIPDKSVDLIYVDIPYSFDLRSANPDISDCVFSLPQNGCETDVLSDVSRETVLLLEQLRYRSSTFCRDMIKHKALNDANNIFNRMV